MTEYKKQYIFVFAFRRFFKKGVIMTSLREVVLKTEKIEALRESLKSDVRDCWQKLAEEVTAIIPKSCKLFASKNGWTIPPHDTLNSWYQLPWWLRHVSMRTKAGEGVFQRYTPNNLVQFGFDRFDVLEQTLEELALAWNGLIRIEIDKSNLPQQMLVRYYAVELEINEVHLPHS